MEKKEQNEINGKWEMEGRKKNVRSGKACADLSSTRRRKKRTK